MGIFNLRTHVFFYFIKPCLVNGWTDRSIIFKEVFHRSREGFMLYDLGVLHSSCIWTRKNPLRTFIPILFLYPLVEYSGSCIFVKIIFTNKVKKDLS